jgi:protein subunit release factor A
LLPKDAHRSALAIAPRRSAPYNFKENRVTDHRIGLTIHQLDQIMEGGIETLIDAVVTHFQAEKLKDETDRQAAGVRA